MIKHKQIIWSALLWFLNFKNAAACVLQSFRFQDLKQILLTLKIKKCLCAKSRGLVKREAKGDIELSVKQKEAFERMILGFVCRITSYFTH
mmetsp:Transcript_3738/g.5481  ORF Transcript_3738/g.5481 Transcript_3738/m.5481 type:complete len:91 (+) Transcript_3738:725-997(+)